jgi:DNA-binding MarR family transcriptional regulator
MTEDLTPYHGSAGHRGVDTSIAAAEDIQGSLGRIQGVVLEALRNAGPAGLTTNEIAAKVRIDRGTVQPRTSELRARGRIADSGQRRPNENGKSAIVWVVK